MSKASDFLPVCLGTGGGAQASLAIGQIVKDTRAATDAGYALLRADGTGIDKDSYPVLSELLPEISIAALDQKWAHSGAFYTAPSYYHFYVKKDGSILKRKGDLTEDTIVNPAGGGGLVRAIGFPDTSLGLFQASYEDGTTWTALKGVHQTGWNDEMKLLNVGYMYYSNGLVGLVFNESTKTFSAQTHQSAISAKVWDESGTEIQTLNISYKDIVYSHYNQAQVSSSRMYGGWFITKDFDVYVASNSTGGVHSYYLKELAWIKEQLGGNLSQAKNIICEVINTAFGGLTAYQTLSGNWIIKPITRYDAVFAKVQADYGPIKDMHMLAANFGSFAFLHTDNSITTWIDYRSNQDNYLNLPLVDDVTGDKLTDPYWSPAHTIGSSNTKNASGVIYDKATGKMYTWATNDSSNPDNVFTVSDKGKQIPDDIYSAEGGIKRVLPDYSVEDTETGLKTYVVADSQGVDPRPDTTWPEIGMVVPELRNEFPSGLSALKPDGSGISAVKFPKLASRSMSTLLPFNLRGSWRVVADAVLGWNPDNDIGLLFRSAAGYLELSGKTAHLVTGVDGRCTHSMMISFEDDTDQNLLYQKKDAGDIEISFTNGLRTMKLMAGSATKEVDISSLRIPTRSVFQLSVTVEQNTSNTRTLEIATGSGTPLRVGWDEWDGTVTSLFNSEGSGYANNVTLLRYVVASSQFPTTTFPIREGVGGIVNSLEGTSVLRQRGKEGDDWSWTFPVPPAIIPYYTIRARSLQTAVEFQLLRGQEVGETLAINLSLRADTASTDGYVMNYSGVKVTISASLNILTFAHDGTTTTVSLPDALATDKLQHLTFLCDKQAATTVISTLVNGVEATTKVTVTEDLFTDIKFLSDGDKQFYGGLANFEAGLYNDATGAFVYNMYFMCNEGVGGTLRSSAGDHTASIAGVDNSDYNWQLITE